MTERVGVELEGYLIGLFAASVMMLSWHVVGGGGGLIVALKCW